MLEVICAGYGGQGILVMGLILADAAMEIGKNVSWVPSYGAEMRGGTANCHVKLNTEEIYSPYISQADVLLALNEASIIKFQAQIKPGGCLLFNESLINQNVLDVVVRRDIVIAKVAATDLALKHGNPRGTNVVMLGALTKFNNYFSPDYLKSSIGNYFAKKDRYYPANDVCFCAGLDNARQVL